MHGILDILRNTNGAGDIQRYQVRYEDLAGNSFIGSMNEQELHDLLYHKLPMSIGDAELDSSYERLKEKGRITMKTLDLDQSALAGAGLEYLPAEG